ncbi:alpha-amylase family glycosyl hydrolase [Tessaracoccus lubricantis]|uniref:1,4-alpha-glucan branching enzyme n=2 Tax=Tessaracoccus lubricantis TaxID=545543 RepID=A0ABP9FBT6_9ACTN
MGAIVADGGVGFRVWAPNADEVSVFGEFNDWDTAAHPLTRENDEGYWYGYVEGAKAGQEYKFHLVNGDLELDRNDPYAREVTNSVGNSVIVDPLDFDWEGDDYTLPAHNEIVVYEAHVGSFFAKGDDNGDFAMMAQKLQHVVDLGCNVVQLMPVAEFAGDLSWGYNPAHIFAVESGYGGPRAYREFVKQAHRMGLGVIQDVVYNHFGPSDLDLWQFDGWQENDKGGIYFYNDHRSSTPWGDTRPDYGRAEVRRFIHDNALMWLREFHVDGLRYDMTPYMRSVDATGFDIIDGWTLQSWINRDIREQFPDALLIAEDMHSNPLVTGFDHDGAGYHSQWDPNFVHPVRKALREYDDAHRSIDDIADALTFTYDGDAFRRVVYTESHDEVANGKARVVAEVQPGDQQGWFAQKRSTLGAALVMTAPGIPMLFQGQEFLQGDWFRDDVPLDWHLRREHHGIVQLYADLITLRRNLFGESRGLQGQGINVFHRNEGAKVLAFQRWYDHGVGDDVVVVANFSGEARDDYRIGLPTGGRWELKLNSDATLYSDDFGDHPSGDLHGVDEGLDGFGSSATLTVAPYSVLIYSYAG